MVGKRRLRRGFSAALIGSLVASVIFLSACGRPQKAPTLNGETGYRIALDLARQVAFRSPYTEGEKKAADFIVQQFQSMGYQPERQAFTDESGQESANIVVKIPGNGFWQSTTDKPLVDPDKQTLADVFGQKKQQDRMRVQKQVIIGAHYDTPLGEADQEKYPTYNGLSGNASGIGVLFEVAERLRYQRQGFDVILVAFGAGNDHFKGAQAFVDQMSQTDLSNTDAVYVVESIYGGDKLYAHAGRNALTAASSYEMRRKLYQTTDVIFESNLPDDIDSDILFNEGMGQVAYPPDTDNRYLYREFTLTDSDYVPFDEKGLPIVYLESANYDYPNPEDCRETKRPAFNEFDGHVRGTVGDSTDNLSNIMGLEKLKKRIHTISYVLIGCLNKGIEGGQVILDQSGQTVSEPPVESQKP